MDPVTLIKYLTHQAKKLACILAKQFEICHLSYLVVDYSIHLVSTMVWCRPTESLRTRTYKSFQNENTERWHSLFPISVVQVHK